MRQRILSLVFPLCLAVVLAACGGSGEGPAQSETEDAPMTEEAYQAEVEAASTTMGEAIAAMSGLSATDETSLRAGIEAMRDLAAPLRDLAAISNPPESYAEAHTQVAAGCTLFADSMDGLCDSATALLDGEIAAEDYETAVAEHLVDLTEAATQMSQGFALMEQ